MRYRPQPDFRWPVPVLAIVGAIMLVVMCANLQPPAQWCADAMHDPSTGDTVVLPLHALAKPGADRNLILNWHFHATHDLHALALYVSKASPFVAVRINQRNLTPEIDLDRRDVREFGPQLYPIPADALHQGDNVLALSLAISSRLVVTQIGKVCVGDIRMLHQLWLANWWRDIGVPAVCLALFAVLGLIAATLALLHREVRNWRWYLACLIAAAYRPFYLIVGTMPGGPDIWRGASDFSILFFAFAIHRLLLQFWNLTAQKWSTPILIAIGVARLMMLLTHIDHYPALELTYWLVTTLVASTLVVDIGRRAKHAPSIERASLGWALCMVITCAVLNVLTAFFAVRNGMQWVYPFGTLVLVATIGFLLVRRTTLGARLLVQAMDTLGARLDDVLAHGSASADGTQVWSRVSSELAVDERQRMLGVIENGFGMRMLDVLLRIQNEHPHSRLSSEIQRALLDLRLMIDAIDSSCQTVGTAFALLQRRLRTPLAAAAIRCRWQVEDVADWQIQSRRKLTDVLRCMEELMSNVIQHAQAREVCISAQAQAQAIEIRVEDDGLGIAPAHVSGRGLRNLQQRMHALGGTFTIASRPDEAGTCATLRMPRI